MTVVPEVPLVSLVPVGISASLCSDDHSACGASGVLGACWCFCEVLW